LKKGCQMSVQISAYIEDDIKRKMEQYSSAHGLKKGFLVQNALDYYLTALHEIPANFIVPSHITVDKETFDTLVSKEDKKPTDKLKALLDAH